MERKRVGLDIEDTTDITIDHFDAVPAEARLALSLYM